MAVDIITNSQEDLSMGKYGDAAVQATNLIRQGGYHPGDAWKTAIRHQFPMDIVLTLWQNRLIKCKT